MTHSNNKRIVFKYGGNAMLNNELKFRILEQMSLLRSQNFDVVLVHGGGPFIRRSLDDAGIETEFVNGQRVTSRDAILLVEKVLKGEVNSHLVSLLNAMGQKAVGLSGKDGMMVECEKLEMTRNEDGNQLKVDMGYVGEITDIDTGLLDSLLDQGYFPVISCLGTDSKGNTYNVNGDIFAGRIAGALKADIYVVLTDVDGLMKNIDEPESLISNIDLEELSGYKKKGIIKGGMIPKVESMAIALENGVQKCMILNGTRPNILREAIKKNNKGTLITHKQLV